MITNPRSPGLPPLDLNYALPEAALVMSTAGKLARAGLLYAVETEARSKYGVAPLRILCKVQGELWAAYIEPQSWTSEAVERFVTWSAILRTSDHSDVKVGIYSLEPPTPLVEALNTGSPLARLQLEGFLRHRPFEFNHNGRLLLELLRPSSRWARWFKLRLKAEPATLKKLDEFIDASFGESPAPVTLASTVHLVGCLTGEILRLAFNGKWQKTESPAMPTGYSLQLAHAELNPLGKAEKRFLNGREDSLWFFYEAVVSMLRK